jgi:hypothetical protein
MTVFTQKHQGTAVTRATFDSTHAEAHTADDAEFVIQTDLWEEVEGAGSTRPVRRRLARAGERVRQSDINRWFPTATVTAVSPATGAAAGGTAITVTGTHLRGVTAVKIGGTNCTGTLVCTETRITGAITPAKVADEYAVTVADDSGTTTNTTPTFTTS